MIIKKYILKVGIQLFEEGNYLDSKIIFDNLIEKNNPLSMVYLGHIYL